MRGAHPPHHQASGTADCACDPGAASSLPRPKGQPGWVQGAKQRGSISQPNDHHMQAINDRVKQFFWVFLEETGVGFGRLSEDYLPSPEWAASLMPSTDGPRRTDGQRKDDALSLCSSWNIHPFLPLATRVPVSQAFGLGLNHTASFPGSPARTQRTWDFLGLHSGVSHPPNKPPQVYLYISYWSCSFGER